MIPRSPVSAILSVCLITFVSVTLGQTTYYVNGTCGDDNWTGSSPVCSPPDGPKRTIQVAIDASASADTVIVADGVYTGPGNVNLNFLGRDIVLKSANGPEQCVIDCERGFSTQGFIFRSGETRAAVVDGLTIKNSFASDCGGAITCRGASPTIRNCIITENEARCRFAGGIFITSGNPAIIDCIISNNKASHAAGIYVSNGDAVIRNCTITSNEATYGNGGGIACYRAHLVVEGCTITANVAPSDGGGIRCTDARMEIRNCIIAGNVAGENGGGIFCRFGSELTLTDSIIVGNSAALDGGGVLSSTGTLSVSNCTIAQNVAGNRGGGVATADGSQGAIRNCVLWGDSAALGPEIAVFGPESLTTQSVEYSDVQSGKAAVHVGASAMLNWLDGNIDADPLFVAPAGGDFHVAAGSPTIDAGDPEFAPFPGQADIDGELRVWNARVDMGADEFGSFFVGDLNCDGALNGADIVPFFLALGDPAAYAIAFPNCDIMLGDMNCDQVVNGADIDRFFAWLAGNIFPDCNANGILDDCEGIGPLAIVTQPQSTLACVGDTVTLSVETSRLPLAIQWRKNGNPIAGATSMVLWFNPVQLSDAGDYDVIVGDACVSLTSDIATLTLINPSINTQPQSQNVCLGAPLVLSVDATGPALTYQWRKDGTDIPGATDPIYIVPAVSVSDAGRYDVVVANSCGTVWSDPASVSIQTTILIHPAGQTVCENDPVFFTVGATGASLTYQWRKDGVNINGSTLNFFVINAAALSDAGIYDVVVTSAQCMQTSDPAPLVVQQCP